MILAGAALAVWSLCYGTASVLQAKAALMAPRAARVELGLLIRLAQNSAYVGGVCLAGIGFASQIPALRTLPLFAVQGVQAANLVVTALVAVPILGLRIRPREWASMCTTAVGLLLILSSVRADQHQPTDIRFRYGVFGAVVVTFLTGLVVGRFKASAGAFGLGMVAGLAFATAGLAIRIAPSLRPTALARDPALYVLIASGLMALLFYASGLQRGSVTVTTAALLVAQIGGSAAVGLAILGDKAKPGFEGAAVVGVIITVVGASCLAGFSQLSARSTSLPRFAETEGS